MTEPLVSVIVPAYNAERYIERTLRSALDQTYRELEVIVVDDGSTDDTAAVVEAVKATDKRVQLIRQENAGVAAARNAAIAAASGRYVAPLDADDLWCPTKIASQVRRMENAGPDAGMVYCWWVAIDANGRELYGAASWSAEGDLYEALAYVNFIGNASIPLFRRSCLDAVGWYDSTFLAHDAQGCEDWDLTLRVAARYRTISVPEYLVGYRQSTTSMSSNVVSMGRAFELIVDRAPRVRRPQDLTERRARGNFYFYLARLGHRRNPKLALQHFATAVRSDPAVLLALPAVRVTRRLLGGVDVMVPISDLPPPTTKDLLWARFEPARAYTALLRRRMTRLVPQVTDPWQFSGPADQRGVVPGRVLTRTRTIVP